MARGQERPHPFLLTAGTCSDVSAAELAAPGMYTFSDSSVCNKEIKKQHSKWTLIQRAKKLAYY